MRIKNIGLIKEKIDALKQFNSIPSVPTFNMQTKKKRIYIIDRS